MAKEKITLEDGSVYEGELVNGVPHGKGKCTSSTGGGIVIVYEGDWVEAKRTGKGKQTFSNGNVFEGDFVDDKLHGKGKQTYCDGDVYEGDFVDDKLQGKGKITLHDGGVYEGDFVDGKLHGKGKKTYKDGKVEEGDFVDYKLHGKGKQTFSNGNVYEGDFVGGKLQGKGKLTKTNGDVYEGEFTYYALQGNGKMAYANGDVYEGDFVNDKLQGKGKKTYKDGKVEEGDWEDGIFMGDVKGKSTKRLFWHLGLSAAYLLLLWGTEIIRGPWEDDAANFLSYVIRCLPLIIYSLAIGIVTSIYSKKLEDNSGLFLPVLMVLLQSITICVWRGDVGILFIYLIGRVVVNTISVIPGIFIWGVYTGTKGGESKLTKAQGGESKLTKAQEEAVQELKASNNYKFALQLKETLEQMNKGCDFGEPTIGFNFTHKHQAYAEFRSIIYIPSEEKPSVLRIHTTLYGYAHQDHMDYCMRIAPQGGCILDMGLTTVDCIEDSKELIDKVFKVLVTLAPVCNLYVKGKLIGKPSGTLPVYPRQIAVSDY